MRDIFFDLLVIAAIVYAITITPETDDVAQSSSLLQYETVNANFARRLERERDEAREERDKLKQLLAAESQNVDAYLGVCTERDEAQEKAERYRLEANAMMLQRDKAREDATNYYAKIGELEQERDEARDLADRYRVAYCSLKEDSVITPFPWEEGK